MGTNTPNRNLYKPAVGEIGWGGPVDGNFDALDIAYFNAGTWINSSAYKINDIVSYNNTRYRASQAVPVNTIPDVSPSYWDVFAITQTAPHGVKHLATGTDPVPSATDSTSGIMAAVDHAQLTANTTKLAGLPTSIVAGANMTVTTVSGTMTLASSSGVSHTVWNSSTAYVAGDVVGLTDGTLYGCILANTNQTPPNVTYWKPAGVSVSGASPIAVNGSGVVSITTAADGVTGAMSGSDHTTLTAHSTKLATLPASVTGAAPVAVNGSGVVSIATATDSVIGAMSAADHTQLTTNTANIATNTSNITTINGTIGSPNTASHFQQLDSSGRLVVVAGVPMDFGNDYLDALTADGADMSIRCARNLTVISGDVGFDANPAQTMTLTLQQRRAGSVIASATLTVSTGIVTGTAITNAGSGYTSAPTVAFSGGGGGGAAATATVSGGVVTGITITNAGSGYTSAPTISFSGGGGSGAAATATVVTAGTVTPSGFPIASILAGDRLRVNLSGTANVTGLNYVFKARAES